MTTYNEMQLRFVPVRVEFTKSWTGGILRGITIRDNLRFVGMFEAKAWIAGVSRAKGRDYTYRDFVIETDSRSEEV